MPFLWTRRVVAVILNARRDGEDQKTINRNRRRQPVEEIKGKIMSIIGKPFIASLATVTGDGKPWCRYVMGTGSDDMTIRFSTFANARKVKHIESNPEVHMNCGVLDPRSYEYYLQVQGTAEITTDKAERDAFWNDEIAKIFEGPDDPNYAIVIVKPYRIEVNTFGSFIPEIWEP
jgi:general stress protein 26